MSARISIAMLKKNDKINPKQNTIILLGLGTEHTAEGAFLLIILLWRDREYEDYQGWNCISGGRVEE